MIKIIDEPAQVNAWITNRCNSCGSRDKEKIETVHIQLRYGGNGMMINLCEDCRTILKDEL